ncbi:hypothetical protein V8F33_003499 [Rhypophila sp. PSN 637]
MFFANSLLIWLPRCTTIPISFPIGTSDLFAPVIHMLFISAICTSPVASAIWGAARLVADETWTPKASIKIPGSVSVCSTRRFRTDIVPHTESRQRIGSVRSSGPHRTLFFLPGKFLWYVIRSWLSASSQINIAAISGSSRQLCSEARRVTTDLVPAVCAARVPAYPPEQHQNTHRQGYHARRQT